MTSIITGRDHMQRASGLGFISNPFLNFGSGAGRRSSFGFELEGGRLAPEKGVFGWKRRFRTRKPKIRVGFWCFRAHLRVVIIAPSPLHRRSWLCSCEDDALTGR